jgi:hypothetical protein
MLNPLFEVVILQVAVTLKNQGDQVPRLGVVMGLILP